MEVEYKMIDTGEIEKGSYLYKTLQIDRCEDINKLITDVNADLVIIKRIGRVDFTHITNIRNICSIKKHWLVISGECSDLGVGIYVVRSRDIIGIENLKTYVSEQCEEEEIAVVRGRCDGEYYECLRDSSHKWYILIKNSIQSENLEVYAERTEDWLYDN